MSLTLIRSKNIVKKYGEFTAVKGVDFDVKTGEVSGFSAPTAPANPPS